MAHSPVALRPAKPTLEEGLLFARYLDTAAEGFFRFLLGRRSPKIIARAFVRPGHDLSYRNVTFAETDGAVLGMISGYTAEQHRRSSDDPISEAIGCWNLRLILLGPLCFPLMRVLNTLADGDYYLQAVAVDDSQRGMGIGSILINFIEERARASGSARLALDVSGKNRGARRLYESRGMTVESRWPKRLRIPGWSFLRMTKTL